jgi:competence protein ComEC
VPSRELLRPGLIAFLALASGQVFAEALRVDSSWPGALLGLIALALLFLRTSDLALAGLFLALGLATQGSIRSREAVAYEELNALPAHFDRFAVLRGELSAVPRIGSQSATIFFAPGAVLSGGGVSYPIAAITAVTLPLEEAVALETAAPGDQVSVVGKVLVLPPSRLGFERDHWVRTQGAVLLLRGRQMDGYKASDRPSARATRSARSHGLRISEETRALLSEKEANLLLGMVVGRTGGMARADYEAFQRTGLVHLFSVSGLHTVLIGGILLGVLRLVRIPAPWRVMLLLLALGYFSMLVGLRNSVLRAAAMLVVFEAQHLLRRPVEPLAALGAVATVLLLHSPDALWQLDFQMTFLCVLALLISGPWLVELDQWLGPHIGWSWVGSLLLGGLKVFAASVAIQVLLAPVLLSWFGEVSLISPLANMILLPLATLLVQVAFAIYLIAMAWPGAAEWALPLFELPLVFLGWAARALAAPSFAVLASSPLPLWVTGLYYLLLLPLAPWSRFRSGSQPRRAVGAFIATPLAALVLLVWASYHPPRTDFTVTFFDVGQGDATLLQPPDGTAWLVDAGPPGAGANLAEQLRQMGITRLQGVVATHADADHIGGMPEVLRAIPVAALYVNGVTADSSPYAELAAVAEELAIPTFRLSAGDELPFARVLHPTSEFLGIAADRNEASLVLMVEHAGRRVLLTGDAEDQAEGALLAAGEELRADVLKCGHHGSANSTTSAFLAAVKPTVAVISCGRGNRYGHPAVELLVRLDEQGTEALRTDRDGTITLRLTKEGELLFSSTRGGQLFSAKAE